MAALRRKQGQGSDIGNLEALVARDSAGAYEALQLFRSRALRFKSKGDPKAAITTAAHGARVLLKTGTYLHAGSELSALALSIIDESSTELDADSRNIINEIDSAYESSEKDGSSSQQRMDFLKSCIKLTQAKGHRELGDPELHVRLGHCLWGGEEGKREIKQAIYHYVAGEAPVPINEKICATFGSNIAKRDQNLVIAVLHFLASENLRDANELLTIFKKEQKTRNAPCDSPLIVFITQLLEVCRRDATPLYKQLVNANLKILDFDERVFELIEGPIGQKFFNIQPKINPMMQMMQQLLN